MPNRLTRRRLSSARHCSRRTRPVLSIKTDRHAKAGRPASGRHWRHDDRPEVIMNLGGRDNHAGSRFLDFAADGWIEAHQPDLTAPHHSRTASSSLAKSGQIGASSPTAASRRASSAHPCLPGCGSGAITSRPSSIVISTLSPVFAPISRQQGLGDDHASGVADLPDDAVHDRLLRTIASYACGYPVATM